jgi:hypothetical protein
VGTAHNMGKEPGYFRVCTLRHSSLSSLRDAGGHSMKIRPILRASDFGEDVAEHDEGLDSYFVETSSFHDVVADRADLVLGPKGSGKTAIFRHLINPSVAINDIADVDVIPAFNPQSAVIFRQLMLPEDGGDTEYVLRSIWLSYILALVGNHLIDYYSEVVDTRPLNAVLGKSGLRVTKQDAQRSIWKLVMERLKRIETSVTVLPDSGIPLLGAKVEFGAEPDSNESDPLEFEDLLSMEVSLYRELGRRCWVLFDRLDEAFQDRRDLERAALRGLLRAHLDISSYGRTVRPKLFFRTDLLDRITDQSGFVNATHMRRQKISWDEPSLVDLVARRVTRNAAFRDAFGINPAQVLSHQERTLAILKLLPAQVEDMERVKWIIDHVTDGTGERNPRNVLTFLRSARELQLTIYDRDDPDFDPSMNLISSNAMRAAYRDVSHRRLTDTLFAEFNHLRPYIEKLRGKQWAYNAAGLASLVGKSRGSQEFIELQSDLIYSGLLRQQANGRLLVPLLYRPALNLQRQYLKKSTEERTQTGSGPEAGARESRKQAPQRRAQQKAQRAARRKSRRGGR